MLCHNLYNIVITCVLAEKQHNSIDGEDAESGMKSQCIEYARTQENEKPNKKSTDAYVSERQAGEKTR